MALTIYKGLSAFNKINNPNNLRLSSDRAFNTGRIMAQEAVDDCIKDIMRNIDNAEYTSDLLMDTPFKKGVNISYLSTGCKTVINIYSNPSECYFATECGGNALIELLKLQNGNAVLEDTPFIETDFNTDIILVKADGSKVHCLSASQFIREWDGGTDNV